MGVFSFFLVLPYMAIARSIIICRGETGSLKFFFLFSFHKLKCNSVNDKIIQYINLVIFKGSKAQ